MDEEFYCIEEKKPEVMGGGFLVFTCMIIISMLFATLV
jgi:hypothetical protein